MAGSTTNFGFNKFPPGTIADGGNKYSLKDRELIDALLFSLFNHDHAGGQAEPLTGFDPLVFPDLTLALSGSIGAGKILYYKIAYLDIFGNETQASSSGTVSTPAVIAPPPIPTPVVATTGGTLVPGTYRYALSYYQTAGGQTPAPNILTVTVPPGTNTNKITLTFELPPDDATGWKIYRRAPDETDYWLLATVLAAEVDYEDDGSANPDCTKRRPTLNTTNATNSVTVAIPASELPLDGRVAKWRIYRTEGLGTFGSNSLVATVSQTTTVGGSDLVTSYLDTGQTLGPGTPLEQTAIPPLVPQIDASTAFSLLAGRLPPELAPVGVRQRHTFLPGTLVVADYDQFVPVYDILVAKLEAFFLTAPTGVDGTDYVTIRVSDDSAVDEVQKVWVTTSARNEIQQVVKTNSTGTFTLTFNGQTTASTSGADPLASEIKTLLENLSNITTVNVIRTTTRTWRVEFVDPGLQNVVQMTGTATSSTVVVTTIQEGTDGGTFTLSDGTDTTTAISFGASAATMETRLETDITSIVDVTVTGTGTLADPWVITWVDPDGVRVPLLQMNTSGLNGTGLVEPVTRGHAPTSLDLDVQTTAQYHSLSIGTTLSDEQEAEDAPAVSTGADVSDANASNGIATELTGVETVSWPVGVQDSGVYTARFYMAPITSTNVRLRVIDANGPTTLDQLNVVVNRAAYTPYYELVYEADGVRDIVFEVAQLSGTASRVDKFEWVLEMPTLHAGAICVIEVLETGTPTTNGDDVQFSIIH